MPDSKKKVCIILPSIHNQTKETCEYECSVQVLQKFDALKNALEEVNSDNEALQIPLTYDAAEVDVLTVKRLLQCAEHAEHMENLLPTYAPYPDDDIQLLYCAEKLGASEVLKKSIARIIHFDTIYDTLYHMALSSKGMQASTHLVQLEPAAARQWLLCCISNAPDEERIELRKKLYALQYTSAEFIALKHTVYSIVHKRRKEKLYWCKTYSNNLLALKEFDLWQRSLLHQMYCAARPSYALACDKFVKKMQLLIGNNNPTDDVLVDLSDCYLMDDFLLKSIITYKEHKYKRPHSEMVYFKHLPQIHLPLLELLIHYKNICYYKGDGGYNPSVSQITFGMNTVELDPVDIESLPLFSIDHNRNVETWCFQALFCSFMVDSKKDIHKLKGALSRLRRFNTFFIKFWAHDATFVDQSFKESYDSVAEFHNDYSSVWVNNWFLRGILVVFGLYCMSKVAHNLAHNDQIRYDTQYSKYKTELQQCAATIPEHVQSVAKYLADTKFPVSIDIQKNTLKLPAELSPAPFVGDPTMITIGDINAAKTAACTLGSISSPWSSWSHLGYLGAMIAGFGLVSQFIYVCNWLKMSIITACEITIVKPRYFNGKEIFNECGKLVSNTVDE